MSSVSELLIPFFIPSYLVPLLTLLLHFLWACIKEFMIIDHISASYRIFSPTDFFAALIYNLSYTYRKSIELWNHRKKNQPKQLSEGVYWK